MKIVLVQPRAGFLGASYWEPLGLGYIASFLKSRLPDIEVEVYSQAFDDDKSIIMGCIDADFVGFGCTTPQLNNALELNRRIKLLNPGVFSVFGGYEPTARPFETSQLPDVDQVIVGEGERGMLAAVRGNKMRVVISPPIEKLDSFPYPDRELIKNRRHVELAFKETGEKIASIQASRGCPFQCLPCSNIKMHGSRIRVRNPTFVVNEMKKVKEQLSLDFIKFCDATFNTTEKRVLDFCAEIQKQGVLIPFGCNIHPSIGSYQMFEALAKAGCREVWVGVESGSLKILKEMRKGVTVERIREVFKLTHDLGLVRRAYFLIGSPSETPEDIELTEKLAEEIDADVYGFTILCPFPGTDLFDPVKYKDIDWSCADEYGNRFYRNLCFTNEELWKIRERLADKFKDKICWRLKKEHEN